MWYYSKSNLKKIILYKKDGRQRQRVPIGTNPQYNQKRGKTLLLGSKRVQV